VKNHDAGDVRGLEEVFRSQEISRTSGGIGSGPGMNSPENTDVGLLRRMFGHASSALHGHREVDAAAAAAVSAEPPWKNQSSRYWTIGAFSAVVALVVAGVTAGTAHHGPSNRSAQGAHGTAGPHGLIALPGAVSTGPTAPGSITGSIGLDALALGTPPAGERGSGNEPGGRVTLIGAATTTGGTLSVSGGGSPGSGPPGGGSSGASPGSSGSNPVSPVAAGVGNTVATVGTSVTGVANQLGSTVPAAAPATSAATSAVSGVLESVDQAVSATSF
jgi:hypothetical protein